jgi:hypothetical protein
MGVYNNAAVDNNFASDAEWRAFCLEFQSAILASGFLVAASDTGQIDLTSASRPAINTHAGFKMYRADDALQATKPIFVKVEFGCGNATNRPKISVTVSTGTNGAGTQTGQVSTTMAVLSQSADGTGAARVFGCGDDTSAHAVVWDGAGISSAACMFSVSRPVKRSDKSAVGDFIWASYSSSAGGTLYGSSYYTDFTSAWTSLDVAAILAGRPDGVPNTGGDINTVYLFDCVMYRGAVILTLPVVIGRATEVPYTDPAGGAFTISVWGSSRTFTPVPFTSFGTSGTGKTCVPWVV